ncbi:hypothetical protein GI584_13520 [Gracilibacillus salitolerans]|uniref:Uncharacterized protein n=1 Tax=Gracilibacillus salitolerans TaxID=2663022 RepID=A0A5Q2TJV0_9BACI|nr:hypothetical protein [Gracilibacillus salitolerans]QGH34996.1 hypothetical protein GI584_13520 [Gracilibacillus salitolerans]
MITFLLKIKLSNFINILQELADSYRIVYSVTSKEQNSEKYPLYHGANHPQKSLLHDLMIPNWGSGEITPW